MAVASYDAHQFWLEQALILFLCCPGLRGLRRLCEFVGPSVLCAPPRLLLAWGARTGTSLVTGRVKGLAPPLYPGVETLDEQSDVGFQRIPLVQGLGFRFQFSGRVVGFRVYRLCFKGFVQACFQ